MLPVLRYSSPRLQQDTLGMSYQHSSRADCIPRPFHPTPFPQRFFYTPSLASRRNIPKNPVPAAPLPLPLPPSRPPK